MLFSKNFTLFVFITFLMFVISACDGEAENAGEEIDNAVETMTDSVEDVGDELKDVGGELKDVCDDAVDGNC